MQRIAIGSETSNMLSNLVTLTDTGTLENPSLWTNFQLWISPESKR